jgi:hypothetical protein
LAGFIRYNPRCPSYKRFYKQLSQTRSKIYCPTSTEVRLPRFHVQVSGESELDRLKVKTASWSEQRQRLVRVLYHGGDLGQREMLLKHLKYCFHNCTEYLLVFFKILYRWTMLLLKNVSGVCPLGGGGLPSLGFYNCIFLLTYFSKMCQWVSSFFLSMFYTLVRIHAFYENGENRVFVSSNNSFQVTPIFLLQILQYCYKNTTVRL